jgi:hypothetical protein
METRVGVFMSSRTSSKVYARAGSREGRETPVGGAARRRKADARQGVGRRPPGDPCIIAM